VVQNDAPIGYMERTRLYYRALGYDNDYVWAHFPDVPFTPLAKPLGGTRIGLVTTAGPPGGYPRDENGLRHVWSGTSNPPPESLFTANLAWDRETTHTDDRASYLPIEAAAELAELTPRFHGVPTEYSHRKTLTQDAPEVLARLRDDGAQAAILVPL
jgi:D-proline reductase (dithiol) PrdB